MRKRIFSIIDLGKKKVGIVVIFLALVVTIGTRFVFVANTEEESEVNSETVSRINTEEANRFLPDYYSDGNNASTDSGEMTYKSPNNENGYPTNYESANEEAISRMELSGTWGDEISNLFPNMSSDAVYTVVDIYLDRHLFPNITTAENARLVEKTIEPAMEYLTEEEKKSITSRLEEYY